MRKVLVLLTIIALASACNKEKDIKPQTANSIASIASKEGDGSDCVFNVTVCNGTFIFANQAEYDVVYNCLEQDYEQHNDDFEALYANLNDDDFNDMADQTGFDEDQTLINFELSHSFVSYRDKLRKLEDLWLNNTTLNPATDPDLIDYYDDAVANALASDAGKVMIGTDLYVIDTQGEMWVLPNATCNDIPGLSNDPAVLANTPNVKTIHGPTPNTDCKNNEKNIEYKDYDNGNKKIKCKAKFQASSWGGNGTNVKAKMVSHKKKANGKWKLYKTNLYVHLFGNWTQDCSLHVNYDWDKSKRRNRLPKCGNEALYLYHSIGAAHFNYEVVGQVQHSITF